MFFHCAAMGFYCAAMGCTVAEPPINALFLSTALGVGGNGCQTPFTTLSLDCCGISLCCHGLPWVYRRLSLSPSTCHGTAVALRWAFMALPCGLAHDTWQSHGSAMAVPSKCYDGDMKADKNPRQSYYHAMKTLDGSHGIAMEPRPLEKPPGPHGSSMAVF